MGYRRIPLDDGYDAALVAASDAGENLVWFTGDAPLDDPMLDAALVRCRALGLAPGVEGTPDQLSGVVGGRDVEVVQIVVRSVDDRVRRWFAAGVRLRAHVLADGALGPTVQALAPHVEHLTLDGAALPLTARTAALEAAWPHLPGTDFDLVDFGCPPDEPGAQVRTGDDALTRIRLQGGWLPGLGAGLDGGVDPALAHALGMPRVDETWQPPRDRPIVRALVVAPGMGDLLLVTSTLPGLVRQLRRHSVDAQLHTVWSPPWNLHVPDPRRDPLDDPGWRDPDPARASKRVETAKRFEASFLKRTDASGIDAIVVPGLATAAALWDHPSLPPDALRIVLDFHLMAGADALAPHFQDPRLRVVSCFPSFAGNYLRHGLPLERLRWFPYPLDDRDLPSAPVVLGGPIVAAGNQRRRHALLAEAVAGRSRPVHLFTAGAVPAVPPLVASGTTDLRGLHDAILGSRFVVLPVGYSPVNAAGITIAAMARRAGRPVVATRAWGLVDHHVPGVDSLFVPPEDADALGAAIARLDEDDALLGRLAEGTRTGCTGTTAALAEALTTGSWPVWPDRVSSPSAPDR